MTRNYDNDLCRKLGAEARAAQQIENVAPEVIPPRRTDAPEDKLHAVVYALALIALTAAIMAALFIIDPIRWVL